MGLTSSMEDYLETVLILDYRQGYVRCIDIAAYLDVSAPSVSRAMKELRKSGKIVKAADGTLSLTKQGRQIAKRIYEKHRFFTRQLIEAGVPHELAVQDACKLEHAISAESFERLKKFVQKIRKKDGGRFDEA